MLKATMCCRKILVVLDDVDRIEQLEALAGEPDDWFKSGSRIIITTRDEQVLISHRVKFVHDVNLLSSAEAICLFSRYAFQKELPIREYEELSGEVVQYADGLPLTIKVLGSFLCGKDKLEWENAIDRLKKIPLKETQEKLKLSYDSLEDDYKEIFLDVACILKRKHKAAAITILESCGFYAIIGLKVLEQRSLITVDEYGFLGMHDHIEEMGKNIVRREHPDEPHKHSRLWIYEEIKDILANDKGTEATRCLQLDLWRGKSRIVMNGLGKMKELRYLEVNFAYFDSETDSESDPKFDDKSNRIARIVMKGLGKMKILGCLEVFSESDLKFDDIRQCFTNSLKYLKCTFYPFLYLPKTFQANNLVGLDVEYSQMVQLWEEGERKVLIKLKFLSLSYSKLTTFDFGLTPNIETLSLKGSRNLEELCMPFSCQKLKHLNISGSKLITFDLGLAPNLETLSLESSGNLEELCMPFSCQKLKHLHISPSKLRTFDLGLTPNLETLSLKSSGNLEELCMPFSCQKLKHLNISDSKLRTFDLGLTPNLETLSLDRCAQFEELHVPVACANLKILNLHRSRLRSLNLELIPNLENLDLSYSHELVEIKAPVGCLSKLVDLNLRSCLRFRDFTFYSRRELKVNCSADTLYLDGESLDSCPLHPNSNLPKFEFICRYEEYLPTVISQSLSLIGNIEKLISFGLCACTDFEKFSNVICSLQCLQILELRVENIPEFPKYLGQLECLEELSLCSEKIKHLPDSIFMLKHLKRLSLMCALLEKLPEDIGQLECLERLHVSSKKIEFLPDSICMLKRLKSLHVSDCSCLGKLPEDIGQLESLETLYLSATKIKHLPDSICNLKHLTHLNLCYCALLEKLPEDLGRLECLKKLEVSSKKIEYLPDSICMLKHLNYLNLEDCALLEKLPEDLGRLECLKKLEVSSKKIEYLPDSIRMLKHLTHLSLKNCALLEKLPEDLGKLECLEELIITNTGIISDLHQRLQQRLKRQLWMKQQHKLRIKQWHMLRIKQWQI